MNRYPQTLTLILPGVLIMIVAFALPVSGMLSLVSGALED